jgi:type I restriction enzyme R subunit
MSEAEWQTRKKRIDANLRSLNPTWKIIAYRDGLDLASLTHHAVTEFPTENGPADYALFVNSKLIGIIEAKKVGVGPQNVLEQAKRYSNGVRPGIGNWNGYRVPFLYATNGEIIWFIDVRDPKALSRQLRSFHTAPALEQMFATDPQPAANWLLDTPVERITRLRDYQRHAIEAIEKTMLNRQRYLMVAMATGTGKTYMTVAQIYRLLESGLVRRVLFLVDRKALAAQAVREFSAFQTPQGNKFNQEYEVYSQRFQKEDFGDDQPFDCKVLPNEYLTNPKPSHTFVYVSTIQRMTINLFGGQGAFPQNPSDPDYDDEADKLDIPIHAFDLIIADECHRGYTVQETSIWRETINYFDAFKIGLTATPAAHTCAIFGEPVFRYGVEQAIQEGYLVDYEAVSIKSNVRLKGVFLKQGEEVGKVDTATGEEVFDEVEDEREFPSEEIERRITAPQSNRKIIQEIAKYAYQHEQETGHFPKILIFAVNDLPHTSHADQLVKICREEFKQGDAFVQKITGNPNVDRPLQRIREFRNRPNPKIVVTVDMLSTGVDIPALEFIVFLRPVKSRILWEQMLGRGTRRCDELSKTHFTIFDCFGGTLIKYFKDVSNFKVEEPRPKPLTLPQVIENIWQNVDRQYHVGVLVKRLRRIEKDMSGKAREDFAKWIPDGDVGKFAADLPGKLRTDFTVTMKLLRDLKFQDLLLNYERAKRQFWVTYDTPDEVTSTLHYGDFDRPEDYLTAFTKFVREKSDNIDAIKILMARPKDWTPEALEDLRRTLRQNDFEEATLRKAHNVVYSKPLADVISMVKHAARQEEPILTAPERVKRAMERIVARKFFTNEQKTWLALIEDHLTRNLSIAEDDFEVQPVFTDRGGRARARKIFPQQLLPLIEELNAAVAA